MPWIQGWEDKICSTLNCVCPHGAPSLWLLVVPAQAMSFWYCFTLLVSLNFLFPLPRYTQIFSQLTPFLPISANSAYSAGFSWPSALKCWKIAILICFTFYSHLHFFFLIPFTTGYSSYIFIGLQIYFPYESRNSMGVGHHFANY